MKILRVFTALLLTTVAILTVAACGGTASSGKGGLGPADASAASHPTAADLGGHWKGQWQNSTPNEASGTFSLDWSESGSDLSGTTNIDETPCLSSGSVTGSLDGDTITFGVVSGETTVDYTGAINADGTMSGRYATSCGNARGTWWAVKS